jgi:hypothetical protein
MCRLLADTGLKESKCILHVYWLVADTRYEDNQSTRLGIRPAADTRYEDNQSTGLGISRLPIPLTLQQPKRRKKMEHLANQEAYLACAI